MIGLPGQPEPIDGRSILPLLHGGADERSVPIGFQTPVHTENGGDLSVIDGDKKLISLDEESDFQLYDLAADLYETKDLTADRLGHVEEFRE